MRKRWMLLGVVAVAVVALTAGIAFAAGRGSATPTSRSTATTESTWQGMVQTCDAMHDSPAMEAMRDRMPANLRARCDAMHEQMASMMQGAGSMMGGSGMMNGSGMMTGGGMAAHHATPAAGK